jgi:NADPH-dependent curcumin reductase CurA
MEGATISRVEISNRDDFEPGDLVLGYGGWQEYSISDGRGLTRLDAGVTKPSLALGVLGMPGFTAYMGLLDIGQPRKGETVVVAAATGAVGSVVGQIAKIKECRAVGIAGGTDKCRYAIDELGFDDCIDRHAYDFSTRLQHACPQGIDIYFESVGGNVSDAVLPLLNIHARVPLCGLIAHYNDIGNAPGPDRLARAARTILTKRIKIQGFITSEDYGDRFDEFSGQMGVWVREGSVKFREDVVDGLENAPKAFIGMLEGRNFGKLVVHISHG